MKPQINKKEQLANNNSAASCCACKGHPEAASAEACVNRFCRNANCRCGKACRCGQVVFRMTMGSPFSLDFH